MPCTHLAKTVSLRTLSVLAVAAALVVLTPHGSVGEGVEGKTAPLVPADDLRAEPTEAELTQWLRVHVPEVDLETVAGAGKKLLDQGKELSKEKFDKGEHPIAKVVESRSDLRGLPLQLGAACRVEPSVVRGHEAKARIARGRAAREAIAEIYVKLRKPDAVPSLEQVLQAEDESDRLYMADALKTIGNHPANQALARRAVFDLSAKVRREAVDALRKRPAEQYRSILVNGLRYPWAPAARHAAEALIALQDYKAIPDLVALLDLPDAEAPVQRADGRWEKPQLVRVNHLRNCLLCHATSVNAKDDLRGQIPIPGEPLPPPIEYYQSKEGVFVRADILYLRQDFSLKQPVENHIAWPEMQRYDYLVRRQEVSAEEAKQWFAHRPASPQRAAILHALRRLTGRDAGDSAAAWKDVLAKK